MKAGLASDGLYVQISSCAAIAAIGRAIGNVLLPQERYTAVSASARCEGDGARVGEGVGAVFRWRGVEMVVLVDIDCRLRCFCLDCAGCALTAYAVRQPLSRP